ncbi:unnamed protein product [Mytilus coruscus]|uniref:Uncharacterized protein n=1 Tax=Mytilus coruscus TaxID=42192 RepID=A0A6J8BAS2_MYTCO|nr:unnamed protein product [Mytilus coruscus]
MLDMLYLDSPYQLVPLSSLNQSMIVGKEDQIPTKLGMNIPAVQKLPLDTQVINVEFVVEKDRGFHGPYFIAYS